MHVIYIVLLASTLASSYAAATHDAYKIYILASS